MGYSFLHQLLGRKKASLQGQNALHGGTGSDVQPSNIPASPSSWHASCSPSPQPRIPFPASPTNPSALRHSAICVKLWRMGACLVLTPIHAGLTVRHAVVTYGTSVTPSHCHTTTLNLRFGFYTF